jgi:hypothetical protein
MKLVESLFIGVPWWSKDGAHLWAQSGGDDSVGYLIDLTTPSAVVSSVMFCLRSPTPPCA